MDDITACTRDCPDACSLAVSMDSRGRPSIMGNPDHPFTSGFVCSKIRDHVERLQNEQRILYPLLRRRDKWEPITWNTALDICAEKIQAYRDEPASILHIQGSGAKGVLKAATALFFSKLGASRTRGNLCDSAGILAYVYDFGSRKNHDIKDLLNAGSIVNWGKDLSRSSIHTAAIIKKARQNGTVIITVSPGGDDSESYSDIHIRVRPGNDRFLAAAVIRRFLDEDRIPHELLQHTKRWNTFDQLISSLNLESLLSACDVSLESLDRLFSYYAGNTPTATFIGAGMQRYFHGGETIRFINALVLISGNIGVRGGGSYYHQDTNHNLNLDWIKDREHKSSRSFRLPLIGEEILNAENPPVQMIWVNGLNVVNQAADSHNIIRAFEKTPFKVVVDAFMTDTAERADLILPSKLMLEQEDIIGSFLHEYVQYVKPVIEAPGEAKEDYAILIELGKRLEPAVHLPDVETCFKKALKSPYLDITFEDLRRQCSVAANRQEIPYKAGGFDHPDGNYRFPTNLHDEQTLSAKFPFRLLSLVRGDEIHSQILPEKQQDLPVVWIAPECEALNHVDTHKDIYLISKRSRLKVALKILPGLHPEAAVYRRGDWIKYGGGINQLIEATVTDMGTGAAFYEQYVRLENG